MQLTISPLLSEADYEAALRTVSDLMDQDPDDGTEEAALLDVLATLVEAYEKKHYPIGLPDPIAALEFRMDQAGLTRKDLEPYIGSRGRVSEVLNRVRPLSVPMMRRLSAGLGIPLGILAQEYPTTKGEDTSEAETVSFSVHTSDPDNESRKAIP